MADYGYQLQDYAADYFRNNIGTEFRNSLRVWKRHMRTMFQHTRDASNLQVAYLQEVKEDLQKSSLLEELAMFALSLMGGAAVSFVSGAIKERLGPKLFGNRGSETRTKTVPDYRPPARSPTPAVKPKPYKVDQMRLPTDKIPAPEKLPANHIQKKIEGKGSQVANEAYRKKQQELNRRANLAKQVIDPGGYTGTKEITKEVFDPDLSKAKGKVVGDFFGKLTNEFGISPLISWIDPGDISVKNAISAVPASVNLAAFKENMENVWDAAESYCESAMQNYAQMIMNDSGWGERQWNKLVAEEKKKGRRIDEWGLLDRGKSLVRDLALKQRQQWANEPGWFFFAYEPRPISRAHAVMAIEAELWALWIRTENFHQDGLVWRGLSGIPIEAIVPRLAQLGLVKTEATLEMQRRLVASKTGAPILPVELPDVDDMVGVRDDEVLKILKWAWERPITLLGGQYAHSKRSLVKDLPTKQQAPSLQ